MKVTRNLRLDVLFEFSLPLLKINALGGDEIKLSYAHDGLTATESIRKVQADAREIH